MGEGNNEQGCLNEAAIVFEECCPLHVSHSIQLYDHGSTMMLTILQPRACVTWDLSMGGFSY